MGSEEKLDCILCKDVFDSKEELQVHFRKHGDPNFKQKGNKSDMSSEKPSENVEMVACDVCSEVFPTISKAITHKHKVHPDHDAKYFCPWCGKLFTMKHLYNKHLKLTHADSERNEEKCFHCDVCDVDFYIPSAMMYHNKFFHRQDAEVPDIGHSKKIKIFNQEAIAIYYCAFCGEEYDNKVNLSKHVTDDHSDENQSPDEVLRCPLCDAIFYHLDAYEVHLTFHTLDDTYSEQNDLFAELTDFSLESVPPVVENVESMEDQYIADSAKAASTPNSVGIDKFLEIAMDTSQDNPVKVKKHKKHKKSKKPAITLDEFLNMNKDVFGEGLDFQGIEEVPTRAVTKRLKVVKKPETSKSVALKELAKLKKHGIVIKKKSDIPQPVQTNKVLKVGINTPVKLAKNCTVNKVNSNAGITTSEDLLSKLMSQSNSSIKIVKKSSQDKIKSSNENTTNEPSLKIREVSPEKSSAGLDDNPQDITQRVEDTNQTKDVTNISKLNSLDTHSDNEMAIVKPDSSLLSDKSDHKSEQAPAKDHSDDEEHSTDIPSRSNNSIPLSKSQILQSNLDSLNNLQKKGLIVVKPPRSIDNDKNNSDHNPEQVPENDHSDEEHSSDKPKSSDNSISLSKTQTLQSNLDSLDKLQKKGLIVVKPPRSSDNETNNTVMNNTKDPETERNKQDFNSDHEIDGINGDDPQEKGQLKKSEHDVIDLPNKSITALKGLSHLITIKPVGRVKSPSPCKDDDDEFENSCNAQSPPQVDSKTPIPLPPPAGIEIDTNDQKSVPDKNPTHDALKNLSKMITVKSVSQSQNSKNEIDKQESENESDDGEEISSETNFNKVVAENVNKKFAVKNTQPAKNKPNLAQNSQITNKQSSSSTIVSKNTTENNANILKRLSHITTKPIITKRPDKVKESVTPKKITVEQNEDEIEIFNIDDSDDENDQHESTNPLEIKQHTTQTSNTLKNLSKNITIKSVNQTPLVKNIKTEFDTKFEEDNFEEEPDPFTDGSDDDSFVAEKAQPLNTKNCSLKLSNKNVTLKNALKNLGKNITIKSRNSSPSQSVKSQDNTQDSHLDNNENNSDSDSGSGNVKITEMNETASDEEMNRDDDELHSSNAIVQSPDDTGSENEDLDDFEKEIEASTLLKTNTNVDSNPAILNTLKNLGKNITIKSMNERQCGNEGAEKVDKAKVAQEIPRLPGPLRKKSNPTREEQSEISRYRNLKKNQQSSNQLVNQKAGTVATSSQVNKEVTVKTYQTETVIQEITTTVTKTIKTVNQTMKQEIRNSSQTNSIPVQRIQGIRPSQGQNLQGVIVRHAQPVRPRHVAPQMRPPGPVIRPSRQIVPFRPGSNTARLSTPRMPVRKAAPNHSQQNAVIGKQLKISPNAVTCSNAIAKRAHSDDSTGPFSCFKKPKESLISTTEMPNLAGGQFASTSQTRSSNFSSTTKVVKGNCVMTSTQMKSEMSSAQQISRLSNNAGLKIVKSSQAQQMQTQEKSESNLMKRTTLAAIEKLQKQGLLVKKPRIEANEDSEHSDFEGDANEGFSSADENDV